MIEVKKDKKSQKMEISKSMAIQLRGLLNTAGKDLMELGQRPHGGWLYHEWKAQDCMKMATRIDKIIKKNYGKRRN